MERIAVGVNQPTLSFGGRWVLVVEVRVRLALRPQGIFNFVSNWYKCMSSPGENRYERKHVPQIYKLSRFRREPAAA